MSGLVVSEISNASIFRDHFFKNLSIIVISTFSNDVNNLLMTKVHFIII